MSEFDKGSRQIFHRCCALGISVLLSTLQQPWLLRLVPAVPLHVQHCLSPETHEEPPYRLQGSLVLQSSFLTCLPCTFQALLREREGHSNGRAHLHAGAIWAPDSNGENSHFSSVVPCYSSG